MGLIVGTVGTTALSILAIIRESSLRRFPQGWLFLIFKLLAHSPLICLFLSTARMRQEVTSIFPQGMSVHPRATDRWLLVSTVVLAIAGIALIIFGDSFPMRARYVIGGMRFNTVSCLGIVFVFVGISLSVFACSGKIRRKEREQ
jgi:hypothetical protein